ncbi:hypothetical protein RRG08_016063 [Elysia crispata]|uniref:Uncharacterized protein n=1 Tax=Elysia crispata TaxID=231223 RepID=A0AAE1DK07_9GAST|nr:hypothetical protein RRG08_016063 [Elysia crispata]
MLRFKIQVSGQRRRLRGCYMLCGHSLRQAVSVFYVSCPAVSLAGVDRFQMCYHDGPRACAVDSPDINTQCAVAADIRGGKLDLHLTTDGQTRILLTLHL